MSNKHIELNNQIMKRRKDGFFDLEKDQEALQEFLKEVDKHTLHFDSEILRLKALVENQFYYNLFKEYNERVLEELHEFQRQYDFKFKSYMAAKKFYQTYSLKTNDKYYYLETYEQKVMIVSLYLAKGDKEIAKDLISSMMEQRYQPATPTFLNAGRARRGELVSCFLLESDDSLNSINYIESTAKQLSKIGGGVAINLSKIRARGESIKDIKGVSKGVIPVAKALEGGFSYADQLGQRPGAGAVYLNIFHYDVIEFLDTKKVNSDEDIRLASISTGLIVPDLFFKLAKENRDMYAFGPKSVEKRYGVTLDDIDIEKHYDRLVDDANIIKRKINARDLLNTIASMQLQSGYPYLMFKDNANKVHPNSSIAQIKMSNLCTEIMQAQQTSVINDYEDQNDIKYDISCNLGSLNIVNVMETSNIKGSVFTGINALTSVADESNIKNAPGVKKANKELHSVGLGAMNLHGYLAKNNIQYESKEAKDFANVFFAMVNYYSLYRSMEIARERGETYKGFNQSSYYSGEYFLNYLIKDFTPQTDKVKELFKDIKIPGIHEWRELSELVKKHGLYHAYRLAIAPTQSISYIQNSTASIMPIVDQIERRTYGDSETFYPMPFLSPKTMWSYKSAFNMDMMNVIDLVAVIQQHIDQGVSTILYVNSDISTRELAKYYIYAHHKGLKSLYYTRNKLLSVDECTSCAV